MAPGGPGLESIAMATKFAFTQRRLESLKVPASGRVTYRDTKVPGLCVRVTEKGAKSAYISRKLNGRHIRYRLGAWPDDFGTVAVLRDRAAEKLGEGLEGLVKQRRQARQEPTVADLWSHWVKTRAGRKSPRSQAEDKRQYDKFVKPAWEKRALSTIDRQDVAALHQRIGKRSGGYQGNRVHSLLRAMFAAGQKAGIFSGDNPCIGVERFSELQRDRFLNSEELDRFFKALFGEAQRFQDAFRLLLLIGCRKSDLLAARWADINLDFALWRISESKTGAVVIPLIEPVLEILRRRLEAGGGSPWVFPSHGRSGHLVDLRKPWERICKAAGLDDVRIHDLRRTLASWMTIGGASMPIVGKALGHAAGSKATSTYARLSTDPVRAAMAAASAAMLAVEKLEATKERGDHAQQR